MISQNKTLIGFFKKQLNILILLVNYMIFFKSSEYVVFHPKSKLKKSFFSSGFRFLPGPRICLVSMLGSTSVARPTIWNRFPILRLSSRPFSDFTLCCTEPRVYRFLSFSHFFLKIIIGRCWELMINVRCLFLIAN